MVLFVKTLSVFVGDLLLVWSDGSKQTLQLKGLRLSCPCAGCTGESAALGNKYFAPKTPFQKKSFKLSRYEAVGLYGLRFYWQDGHSDGIYTYDFLKSFDEK